MSKSLISKKIEQSQILQLNTELAQPMLTRGVHRAGITQLDKHSTWRPRDPSHHLIVYPVYTSSTCRLSEETTHSTLLPNLLWIFPVATLDCIQLKQGQCTLYWFELKDNSRWIHLKQQNLFSCRAGNHGTVVESMECYYRELHAENPLSRRMAQAYADILGVYLDRRLSRMIAHTQDKNFDALVELLDKISYQLHQPWPLSTIAQELKTSRANVFRLTQKYFEKSPHQLLLQIRMKRAEDLLSNTDAPLYEIAETIGYQSAFAFSKAFHRNKGCSPSSFRKQHSLN